VAGFQLLLHLADASQELGGLGITRRILGMACACRTPEPLATSFQQQLLGQQPLKAHPIQEGGRVKELRLEPQKRGL
jgi:hypothetical protein